MKFKNSALKSTKHIKEKSEWSLMVHKCGVWPDGGECFAHSYFSICQNGA